MQYTDTIRNFKFKANATNAFIFIRLGHPEWINRIYTS